VAGLLEFIGLKGLGPAGEAPSGSWSRRDSRNVVKKLLVVVVLGLSAFAVWRKVQADRAELNLWTEATTADD
jgi:hypothetical protein